MTKRIFRSILLVAGAVLLASIVLIMGVLYGYFGGVQERQAPAGRVTQTARCRGQIQLHAEHPLVFPADGWYTICMRGGGSLCDFPCGRIGYSTATSR